MNRLGKETSPYLLQHADNPVDWYAWGEEAFEASKQLDKPILLSVGYATCHWCHVMERESFELEDVASIMNDHFINIKVDREEMPDVDQYYMNAIHILTGSSGWPLNAFLLPDKRPFYGGTYFPPIPSHGKPSWTQLLLYLADKFENHRSELELQADQVSKKVSNIHIRFFEVQSGETDDLIIAGKVFEKAEAIYDNEWGGFGGVPKFPPYLVLKWLLQYGYQMANQKATEMALFTLRNMIRGGIYDQLGGGISRYAIDKEWLIPHFEKMLYDNAQLVDTLSQAFALTQDKEILFALNQTTKFLREEMQDSDGGFFSAWDADSEGQEGKYYIWSANEVNQVCGDHADIVKSYYGIDDSGNFEGMNILTRHTKIETLAVRFGISNAEAADIIEENRIKLFSNRHMRIKPGLDYKKNLSWNALCVYSMLEAARVSGDPAILNSAITGYEFIKSQFGMSPNSIKRISTKGQNKYKANLDDFAMYARAALSVFYAKQDVNELKLAFRLCEHVIDKYYDKERQLFSFLPLASRILHNSFEVMDYTIPSGNSIIVDVINQLGTIYNNNSFLKIADDVINKLKPVIDKYPISMAQTGINLLNKHFGYSEITITGDNPDQKKLDSIYIPGRIILYSGKVKEQLPLLAGKANTAEEEFFLCRNFQCFSPVKSFEELQKLLKP